MIQTSKYDTAQLIKKSFKLFVILYFFHRYTWAIHSCSYLLCWHHRVILNRGSMFAFQWREFSPPLSSAHTLLQCYHSQWEIEDAAIPGEFPLSPPPLGPLANGGAVSSDVTLWRCTTWSGKFASVSSYSIAKTCSL